MNTSAAEIRALLDALTQRRAPLDDREQQSLDRFHTGLDRLHDPCSETADTTHVTSSVIIVGPRGVVLHKHKRLGIWLQPGGHIDPDETPHDAAIREATEETGLPVSHFAGDPVLVHVDAHDGPRGHFHLDLRFLLSAPDVEPAPPEGESPDVRWWSWPDVATSDISGLAALANAMQRTHLRSATPDDARAIAEVYLRSFRWTYDPGLVRLAHDDDDVRNWVATILLRTHDVTVATAAGVVVGFVALEPGWLGHLYVDPTWTGGGVGSMLVAHAKQQQHTGFDLWTFQENVRARTFYEKHGLVAVELTDGAGNEERQPDVRYGWTPGI